MVFPQQNPQDDYFYSLMWSKVITEALVTILLTHKAAGTWSWDSNNGPSIIEARYQVRVSCGIKSITLCMLLLINGKLGESDEEGHPHYQEEVVHALPAQAPDAPLIPKLVIISFDSDNDDIYDMLDSDVELNFTTDEEVNALEVVVSDPIAEVIDGFLNSDDEVTTPNKSVSSISKTQFYYDDTFVSRDSYYLRDGFTTSYDTRILKK
ncbi:hypothetical protein ACS0TY_014054 [Phlomoides rotata]